MDFPVLMAVATVPLLSALNYIGIRVEKKPPKHQGLAGDESLGYTSVVMPRKKILEIIPTLDRSGAEKQLVLLAANLPKDEFDVHVAVLTRTGPLEADLKEGGVPSTLIGKRWKFDPFAYQRLKSLIRRLQPDLVHTWLFAANSYGRQAAVACGVKRIVAGERCVDPWKSRLQLAIDRKLAAKTDRIATNSPGVRDFYVAHGLSAEKFVIIPNAVLPSAEKSIPVPQLLERLGVEPSSPPGKYYPVIDPPYDPTIFNYTPINPKMLRPDAPFLIGIVARLWPQKRIEDALWVFEVLKYVNLPFHAVIIGDGPERDRLLWHRDQWKLSDRVHFVGHRDDAAELIPSFDVLLSTSAYEGQSNTILEAMAAGVPVLATDIPGNRDLVVDGETGILIPDGGDDFRFRRRRFVETTLYLLENAELRRSMGEAAKRRIVEHFSLDQMVRRHAELYHELCGITGPGSLGGSIACATNSNRVNTVT